MPQEFKHLDRSYYGKKAMAEDSLPGGLKRLPGYVSPFEGMSTITVPSKPFLDDSKEIALARLEYQIAVEDSSIAQYKVDTQKLLWEIEQELHRQRTIVGVEQKELCAINVSQKYIQIEELKVNIRRVEFFKARYRDMWQTVSNYSV